VSVLRSIEHRIESLVEGIFGRMSRAHVQPVEIARKLAKEMDDHKSVSVSRVYAPNEYVVYLSPSDREQFADYEASLQVELADYLSEHARREGYALLSAPRVSLDEDDDLRPGEFGIAARMVQPRKAAPSTPAHGGGAGGPGAVAAPASAPAELGGTKVLRPSDTEAVTPDEAEQLGLAREEKASILVSGTRHELTHGSLVLGRSRECDVTISDPNVSRRHAEVRSEDGAYWIVDLNSTNGVEVNGKRVQRARLEQGDRILLGQTEVVFERA
jgi:hypothetical protein